ncbi:hypothetical protein CEXT_103421 [Caerostris extrusa]|uniref:Uncharacterized protein n=1 Tax=Caerostris extrusa TaxID=172846 RepID=A0AAV4Y7M0_CAEEX|nr:hypothetical protein CEXT_103421 [Caerostris extrusa]
MVDNIFTLVVGRVLGGEGYLRVMCRKKEMHDGIRVEGGFKALDERYVDIKKVRERALKVFCVLLEQLMWRTIANISSVSGLSKYLKHIYGI